jgi:hypothetical protein
MNRILFAVVAGAGVLVAGLALAFAAQNPSPPPTLSGPTPIATVTGEDCLERVEDPWDEPPDGVVTEFEAGCAGFVYPVKP